MTHYLSRLIGIVVVCLVAASGASAFTFTSKEWNFTAEFPAAPTLEKTTSTTTAGVPYDQYVWSFENKDGWKGIGLIIYSQSVVHDYNASIQGSLNATKGKLRSQKTIQQSGVQGREIIIDVADGVVRQRLLWINDRLYQAVFSGGKGTGLTPDVEVFLNSFRTLK